MQFLTPPPPLIQVIPNCNILKRKQLTVTSWLIFWRPTSSILPHLQSVYPSVWKNYNVLKSWSSCYNTEAMDDKSTMMSHRALIYFSFPFCCGRRCFVFLVVWWILKRCFKSGTKGQQRGFRLMFFKTIFPAVHSQLSIELLCYVCFLQLSKCEKKKHIRSLIDWFIFTWIAVGVEAPFDKILLNNLWTIFFFQVVGKCFVMK